ncbi:hypothetical protein AXK12_04935 [Cephaloticoccus capnophilus]|uniref:Uncharacterized protein n=1 Tax=Cephaloticoccus capnophilus TaxID=1548208 RepID=A0A139SM13_9BACT|nr:hypothetical protein [Cephaloticoccus capnophilus]KXU35598.1 hypothetical protein AXK12_04935 [Cephaloticoccus capnophilus]
MKSELNFLVIKNETLFIDGIDFCDTLFIRPKINGMDIIADFYNNDCLAVADEWINASVRSMAALTECHYAWGGSVSLHPFNLGIGPVAKRRSQSPDLKSLLLVALRQGRGKEMGSAAGFPRREESRKAHVPKFGFLFTEPSFAM